MTAPAPARVLLVNMPFASLDLPSMSLALLQAELQRAGHRCDARYFHLDVTRALGSHLTEWIAGYSAMVGDWLFVPALYGSHVEPSADEEEVLSTLVGSHWGPEMRDRLLRARDECDAFVDWCVEQIAWREYDVVGFGSMFQQTVASLALARRVKARHPGLPMVFGGANCQDDMGAALHEAFPFVDVVCTGEADETIGAIVEAVLGRRDPATVPGIVHRDPAGRSVRNPAAPVVHDLEALPHPVYDDWLAARQRAGLGEERTRLLFEGSRGCWWGERSHCTFCGLNGQGMAYRSKGADRMLSEIDALRARYGIDDFVAVDNILNMRYLRSLLPTLAGSERRLRLFFEVRAALSHGQVRTLAAAGVESILPGIESLSDAVLHRMGKGTTALQNIQLLKWCMEFGIEVEWNFLHGFPGDTEADYAAVLPLVAAVRHLPPPRTFMPVLVNRFAPLHTDAARLGLTNVRAERVYDVLYPTVDQATRDRIAYAFDADLAPGWERFDPTALLGGVLDDWVAHGDGGGLWAHVHAGGDVDVADLRASTGSARSLRFEGWRAGVLAACDRAASVDDLRGDPRLAATDEDRLRRFLDWCVRERLVVRSGDRFLSVAVHTPPRWDTEAGWAGRAAGGRRRIPVVAAGG